MAPFQSQQDRQSSLYKLELPSHRKIHPVFYISQLKRVVGNTPAVPNFPDQLSPDMELITEPEALLDTRTQSHGQGIHTEVLIKWTNSPTFETTWEEPAMIEKQFP